MSLLFKKQIVLFEDLNWAIHRVQNGRHYGFNV